MRLTEEIILLLLNEDSGYLEQVAGWNLSCVLAGAVLADLDLESRIDTALDSLAVEDASPVGDHILDPVLATIAGEPEPRTVNYWVEKIANTSDEILDQSLDRLVKHGILDHANGGFWSLSRNAANVGYSMSSGSQSRAIVRRRIVETILGDGIPDPRDAIIIGLANACDAFRFLLQPEDYETSRNRIELLSKLDRTSRSVATAVAATSVHRTIPIATKPIPNISLLKVLRKDALWQGNIARLLADLYRDYGPVFALKVPLFQEESFYPRREQGQHLGQPAWSDALAIEGNHGGYGECARRIEKPAGHGWSRTLPHAQGIQHMASTRTRVNEHFGDTVPGDSAGPGFVERGRRARRPRRMPHTDVRPGLSSSWSAWTFRKTWTTSSNTRTAC